MSDTPNVTLQSPLWAVGRRKNAVARARLIPGGGRMLINSRSLDEYFGGHERYKSSVMEPLRLVKLLTNYDTFLTVMGGGVMGQAEAIRLALSRAIIKLDPKLRSAFRKEGLLTRDYRMVERKKSGQPKARRRFQHSKR